MCAAPGVCCRGACVADEAVVTKLVHDAAFGRERGIEGTNAMDISPQHERLHVSALRLPGYVEVVGA
jgi:hypothetical protein